MKRLSNLLAALVFASLVIFMSCGGGGDDPVPSAGETQSELFQGTWNVSGSPQFGTGPEGDWTGFTLQISGAAEGSDGIWGGNFSASNIPSGYGQVWGAASTATSATGTWDFASATSVGTAVRGDGVEIGINNLTANSVTLTFTVTETNRVSGIFGEEWTFTFTK